MQWSQHPSPFWGRDCVGNMASALRIARSVPMLASTFGQLCGGPWLHEVALIHYGVRLARSADRARSCRRPVGCRVEGREKWLIEKLGKDFLLE